MLKNKLKTSLTVGGMVLLGLLAGVATMAGAQTATTATTPTSTVKATTSVDTPEAGDVADVNEPKTHGHAPLGGDGVVASINGSTIVMGEESDEGGASYTIDASKATVRN